MIQLLLFMFFFVQSTLILSAQDDPFYDALQKGDHNYFKTSYISEKEAFNLIWKILEEDVKNKNATKEEAWTEFKEQKIIANEFERYNNYIDTFLLDTSRYNFRKSEYHDFYSVKIDSAFLHGLINKPWKLSKEVRKELLNFHFRSRKISIGTKTFHLITIEYFNGKEYKQIFSPRLIRTCNDDELYSEFITGLKSFSETDTIRFYGVVARIHNNYTGEKRELFLETDRCLNLMAYSGIKTDSAGITGNYEKFIPSRDIYLDDTLYKRLNNEANYLEAHVLILQTTHAWEYRDGFNDAIRSKAHLTDPENLVLMDAHSLFYSGILLSKGENPRERFLNYQVIILEE
jgi:hypothetical protein